MDEFMRRANEYFLEFEGRHLYPKLLSWYWAVWLMTAAAFALLASGELFHAGPAAALPWRGAMFISEIAFLCACFAIGRHKNMKVQAGAPTSRLERHAFMDNKRRAALERICGVESSKFAAIAKECADLSAARKNFRFESDASFGDILRSVYDPDSKARILALLLSAVAIFVALLNHSVAPEDFNILDAWGDDGFRRLFRLMFSLATVGFGVWIGLRVLAGLASELAKSIWAISLGATSGSTMALNYFVRDLVRLHMPARTFAAVNAAPMVPHARPRVPALAQREVRAGGDPTAARVVGRVGLEPTTKGL